MSLSAGLNKRIKWSNPEMHYIRKALYNIYALAQGYNNIEAWTTSNSQFCINSSLFLFQEILTQPYPEGEDDSIWNQCPSCNYRSKWLSDVKRHHRIHTGEKPFACSKCPYRANQRTSLRTHMLRKHTDQWRL